MCSMRVCGSLCVCELEAVDMITRALLQWEPGESDIPILGGRRGSCHGSPGRRSRTGFLHPAVARLREDGTWSQPSQNAQSAPAARGPHKLHSVTTQKPNDHNHNEATRRLGLQSFGAFQTDSSVLDLFVP